MRSVDEREFVEGASAYLDGNEAVWIEREGEALGYFLPINLDMGERKRAEDKARQVSLDRLEAAVQRVREETGMTEDELVDALVPEKRPKLAPRH